MLRATRLILVEAGSTNDPQLAAERDGTCPIYHGGKFGFQFLPLFSVEKLDHRSIIAANEEYFICLFSERQ